VKSKILHILKGTFLVSPDAIKNWRFIIFLSLLALFMIGSSHSADEKVHQIARLSNEVKELKSQYVDVRMQLMQAKMETRVIREMEKKGLRPSVTPPQVLKIVSAKE
jgi:hypothetical protein